MTIKRKLFFVALMATLVTAFSGCEDAHPVQQKYPYLVINDVSDVTGNGAVFNGEFGLSGTSVVTDYGFEWTYESPPVFEKYYRSSLGNKVKSKFSTMVTSDLWSGRNYSVRAYAITAENIVHSNSIVFKSAGSMPPQFISLSPDHGPGNTEVTIVGKNFGHGNPFNEKSIHLGPYYFMDIVAFSDTVIVAKVPTGFPKGRYSVDMIAPVLYAFKNVYFTVE